MTDSYKITKIDQTTGDVTVTYSVDNKSQTISNLPIDDAQALTQALSDYGIAYKQGLAVEAIPTPPSAVTALVGKAQSVVDSNVPVTPPTPLVQAPVVAQAVIPIAKPIP